MSDLKGRYDTAFMGEDEEEEAKKRMWTWDWRLTKKPDWCVGPCYASLCEHTQSMKTKPPYLVFPSFLATVHNRTRYHY